MCTRSEINQLPATSAFKRGAMWCLRLSLVVSKKKKIETGRDRRTEERTTYTLHFFSIYRDVDDDNNSDLRERERREKNLPRAKHLHLTASSSSPKWEENNQKKKGTTDNFATTKGEKKKKKNKRLWPFLHLRHDQLWHPPKLFPVNTRKRVSKTSDVEEFCLAIPVSFIP